jgi:hypothetical protein
MVRKYLVGDAVPGLILSLPVYIQINETQCWSPSTDFLKLVCEFGAYYFVPGDGDVLLMDSSKPEPPLSPSCPRSFLSTDPLYALNFLVNEPNPSVRPTAY